VFGMGKEQGPDVRGWTLEGERSLHYGRDDREGVGMTEWGITRRREKRDPSTAVGMTGFLGVMQILGVMRVSGGSRCLGRARWGWLARSGRLSFRGASV